MTSIVTKNNSRSAIFLTFTGNCRMALSFYQTCFGGKLTFDLFPVALPAFPSPVICGSLVSDRIIIHGSDLVEDEGRIAGNAVAIYIPCINAEERWLMLKKLGHSNHNKLENTELKLVEVRDDFGISWMLGII